MPKASNAAHVHSVLKWTYGLLPIAAGLDKFFNVLVDWPQYLSPAFTSAIPIEASAFMGLVGVVEIIAGILVLSKVRTGAYLVAAWLVLLSLNLLSAGFFDIAVRDLVLAIGAYSLARLSE